MFEVQCPSCEASYQVDERRVPPTGLKMRCPKCGDSFQVEPPELGAPVLGAALGLGAPGVSLERSGQHKSTMLGVAEAPDATSQQPIERPPINVARPSRSDALELAAIDDAEQSIAPDELEAALPSKRTSIDQSDLPSPSVTSGTLADEIELPERHSPYSHEGGLEISADLPTLNDERDEGLPVATDDVLDLPSLGDSEHLPSFGDVDLPSPSDELELPTAGDGFDLPSPSDELDLPTAGSGINVNSSNDELDLPTVNGSLDLPSPNDELDLPIAGGDVDLPTIGGDFDLPAVGSSLDLPASGAGVAGLPEEHELPLLASDAILPMSSGTGSLPPVDNLEPVSDSLPSLPSPPGSQDGFSSSASENELPELEPLMDVSEGSMSSDAVESELESFDELTEGLEDLEADSQELPSLLPGPGDEFSEDMELIAPPQPPQPPRPPGRQAPLSGEFNQEELNPPVSGASGQGFGEVDFSGPASVEEFDAFPTEAGPASAQGASNDEYGDINLGDTDGALDLGADVEHEPAPASVVAGAPAAASAAVERPTAAKEKGSKQKRRPGMSRRVQATILATLLFAAGGGALTFEPQIGAFGSHYLIDLIKESTHQEALLLDQKQSLERLLKDTPGAAEGAFRDVLRKQVDAPRFAPRKTYAAFLGYWRDLRFGGDTNLGAKAKVLLSEVEKINGSEVKFFDLALAAQKLAANREADVTKRAQSMIPKGPEFAAVVGEAALKAKNTELALSAFASLEKKSGFESALSLFGKARAQAILENSDAALAACKEVLLLNSNHVGAQLLIAELELTDTGKDEELVERLLPLTQESQQTSSGQRVRALNLLGQLHLNRGRIKASQEAFEAALVIDRGSPIAQTGLAKALFASGLYSEALAHFESALQRAPKDLRVELGVVEAQLMLESYTVATQRLESLKKLHPKSTAVAYFSGQVAERLDKREKAQTDYESALEFGENAPELVLSYIALTRLHSQQGESEAAATVINEAQKRFPDNAIIYNELAELASERGYFEEAIKQFDQALELDPRNLAFQFSRGVALRQAGSFADAQATFDAIEVASKDYPGLALERGNLYEASGRSAEALKAYETALAVAPDDLDMMLRVGCGRALSGQSTEATSLLEKVLASRSSSAEVNFCLGVSLLNSEQDLQRARRHLQRAVDSDPTRARHHYYLGVVLAKTGSSRDAMDAFDHALELDRTMADVLWRRGELKVRLGQVVDAEVDLKRALALAPERLEAHASLALAYMNMGKEQDAMREWSQAMAAQRVEPEWFYFYGKLLVDNGRLEAAREPLKRGLGLVTSDEEKFNPWIYDAHRYYALSLGENKKAIAHWNKFLSNRPDSPYAPDGVKILKRLSK